jgi:hypothetical protein
MLFFPVVNEACRVLDEGISVKSSDLDVASVMGMGFPSYRLLFDEFLEFCNIAITPSLNRLFKMWFMHVFPVLKERGC